MKKTVFILSLLSVVLLIACASTPEKKESLSLKIGELILSKGIDKTETAATPVDVASNFFISDVKIIASVKLEQLAGFHELKWDWYDPKGELFASSGPYAIQTSEGKYFKVMTAWHRLNIKDEKAGSYPGSWQVQLYVDGKLVAAKDFTVE